SADADVASPEQPAPCIIFVWVVPDQADVITIDVDSAAAFSTTYRYPAWLFPVTDDTWVRVAGAPPLWVTPVGVMAVAPEPSATISASPEVTAWDRVNASEFAPAAAAFPPLSYAVPMRMSRPY